MAITRIYPKGKKPEITVDDILATHWSEIKDLKKRIEELEKRVK